MKQPPSCNMNFLFKRSFVYFSIGDWGAIENTPNYFNMQKVSRTMNYYSKKYNPQFVVSLGDNFYDYGVNSVNDKKWKNIWYDNFIEPNPIIKYIWWMSVLGNKDYFSGIEGVESQIKQTFNKDNNWYMPDYNYGYYNFESQSYHLFIDTCRLYPDLYPETKELYTKLNVIKFINEIEGHLKSAKTLQCKFILVYGHYHIFSNGHYQNYDTLKDLLCPLFDKYEVDFYISGHEHSFQVLKYHKTYFIINGAGSASAMFHKENINKKVKTIYVNNNNGFCSHSICGNTYSIEYINTANKVEYEFSITK
jgi:tartrate-resistant acid phosphatase type 5